MWGKDRANLKSACYLSQNIYNSQLKMIDKAGHILNEEKPQELANLLNNFLKEE